MENIKLGSLLRVRTLEEIFEQHKKLMEDAPLGSITVKEFMRLIRKEMEMSKGIKVTPTNAIFPLLSKSSSVTIPFGYEGLLLTGIQKEIDGTFYKVLYKENEFWISAQDVEIFNARK